ncbi:MAG: hypothetical protein LBJ88_02795 [Campylobacteraceae bacterium]|jgi:hypothetical protein|nr:hypothetical protein [Campylobacteraceae bacterium]
MKIRTTLSNLKLLFISVLSIVCLVGCDGISFFGKGSHATASTPIIEVQPVSANYIQGNMVIPLELTASVNDGGVISYQWYSNTINSNENGSIIPGETNSSYAPPILVAGTIYYYVVITNTNDNIRGESTASITSDVVSITVDTLSVSFYDENLNLLAKYDNLSSGHEVELNSNKTAYGITDWYIASNDTTVDLYTLTDKNVNFYALSNVTEITTQADLASIATTLAGKYILLNDIELDENGAGFEDTLGWIPIGNQYFSSGFTGIFNGNYHKITNLWINRTSEDAGAGLFGSVYNATISNLGVEIAKGKELEGTRYVGGIVGWVSNSNITNVYSTGDISGNRMCIGGIAGWIEQSNISNVYSTGNISGGRDSSNLSNLDVGGIVGWIEKSNMSNVYSTGNISGIDYVGGIAGWIEKSNITNTYSTGDISGEKFVGGIAGCINNGEISDLCLMENINDSNAVTEDTDNLSNVLNNVAINSLVIGDDLVNRAVGSTIGTNIISNNFALDSMKGGVGYDGVTNNFTNVGNTTYHGTDKTLEQLKTKETYSDAINGDGLGGLGWQFGDNDTAPWKIDSNKNNGYPYFYWQD